MLNLRLARPMLIALAACAANFLVQGSALADDAQENKALKEQMRQMMQRMDALQKQVEALQKQQAAPPPVVTAPPAPPPAAPPAGPALAKQAPPEPAFEKFAKGFYGTLDVSADYVTKGMSDLGAFHYSPYDGTGVYTQTGQKVGPVGRVGWQADLSTNKSVLGYRGSHTIPGGAFDFIYQIEVQPSITSAPGASTGYTAQSNVTKAGIGYGNSFVGISNNELGKLKAGTTYTPYKQSTDRMNPFSGMLGDYAVVMGNTGGDNRVEFGTRLDH
ncbi:MAG TPA: porin, partial [Steroidobacteraceae bacterium]|nr:porin [Steroidobacteraceae bacterium]